MKTHVRIVLSLFLVPSISGSIVAQPASNAGQTWSGQITYEVVRKVDPSSMRIMINGEQVRPGDPNFPSDIPDTRTFGQKVLVAGKYAKESRDEQNAIIRRIGGGAPQPIKADRPFDEQVFVDLGEQKTVTLLTVGKDKEAKTYRAESLIKRAGNWQLTDQTKKISGYTCRKATVPYNKETYTVWVTTELPVTYSPIHELTPETGIVLLIEGAREQFKATKISTTSLNPATVTPNTQALVVTSDQLTDLRQKAVADFQQQMMMNDRN